MRSILRKDYESDQLKIKHAKCVLSLVDIAQKQDEFWFYGYVVKSK